MAKYLSPIESPRHVWCLVAAAIWSLFSQPIAAQGLIDPTRPPEAIAVGEAAPVAETGPVLQSVIISQRRAEAIISGRTVKVGDKVGEATVVKIAEGEVLLRQDKELRALKLFPNIEKRNGSVRSGHKVEKRQQ